jgi:cysteine desulfurase
MSERPIYLDYNATTPIDKEVLKAMLPYLTENYGNASSKTHSFGWIAAEAIEIAREQTAELLGAESKEIIFTSGATESLNLAIQGVAQAYSARGRHFVSFATEHKAVLDVLQHLKVLGYEISILDVDSQGNIDEAKLEQEVREDTLAVISMLANNETGKVLPVERISAIARKKGALVICDASQAIGKMKVNVDDLGVDLLAISAHKFYGPKGVAALYVRRKKPRVKLQPIIFGGGQESGIRAGTLPTHQIAGLGMAAKLSMNHLQDDVAKLLNLRNLLEQDLTSNNRITLNMSGVGRLPNTINFRIRGLKADRFFPMLPELSFSSGSACTSALKEPSHVLLAMGLTEEEALESYRISIGKYTNADSIEKASKLILGKLSSLG